MLDSLYTYSVMKITSMPQTGRWLLGMALVGFLIFFGCIIYFFFFLFIKHIPLLTLCEVSFTVGYSAYRSSRSPVKASTIVRYFVLMSTMLLQVVLVIKVIEAAVLDKVRALTHKVFEV